MLSAFFAHPISKSYQEYFLQGDKALIEQEFDKAIYYYLKGILLAKPRESLIVKDDLGYAYLQIGKLDRAKEYLKPALKSFSENYDIRFYLGVVYLIDGKFELAAKEFNTIEENIYFDDNWIKIAESSQIYNPIGDRVPESQWKRLRNEKGVALHPKKSKNKNPPELILDIDSFDEKNQGVFHFVQGVVLNELGQEEQARTKFLEAKKAGYEWDKLIRSRIHHRLKGHDIFLAHIMHRDFFKTLRSGRLEEAIVKLEKTLRVGEESPVIHHNLALLYFDLAKLEEKKAELLEKAEICCARALWFHAFYGSSHKERLRYLELMGNIYFFQGDYKKSEEEFLDMLTSDPKDANTHYNLGCVYYHQKLPGLAESEWIMAIDLDQNKRKREESGQSSDEEMSFTVTVRKKSISFFAQTCLGKLYLEQKQPDKAVPVLEEAIKLKPRVAETYFALAKACHFTGQEEKARSCLEKYLFLGGNREKAEELEAALKK